MQKGAGNSCDLESYFYWRFLSKDIAMEAVMGEVEKLTAAQSDNATDTHIAQLIAALGSKDPHKRERSREALVSAGHAALIPLIEKLTSTDDQVCWEAAKALGEIKDPAAAKDLAETLDHNSGDVAGLPLESLIALGTEGLKQTLIVLLTKAGSVPVQQRRSGCRLTFRSSDGRRVTKAVVSTIPCLSTGSGHSAGCITCASRT